MELNEVYENLCLYDKRNPLSIESYSDEDLSIKNDECFCDNCFYGRNKLALEIIELHKSQEPNIQIVRLKR